MSSTSAIAQNWALAVYLLGVLGMCVFMVGASYFLGGRAVGRAKGEPFESGVVPQGGTELRFSAKFYLVTMMFVIFDVEALFLYAWAVSVRESGWAGFLEVTIFITVLLAGLVYIVGVGVLDWAPEGRKRRSQQITKVA